MRSILHTCQPRADLHTGSFNPEIFTATLSQVTDCYRGRVTPIHTLYTDAEQFFREATYPTQGLCTVLAEVFGRLAWRLPLVVAKPMRGLPLHIWVIVETPSQQ